MLFFSRKHEEDEPHTIISTYLQGKGRVETYYYGEAQAHIEPIEDFSQLRVTKGTK